MSGGVFYFLLAATAGTSINAVFPTSGQRTIEQGGIETNRSLFLAHKFEQRPKRTWRLFLFFLFHHQKFEDILACGLFELGAA